MSLKSRIRWTWQPGGGAGFERGQKPPSPKRPPRFTGRFLSLLSSTQSVKPALKSLVQGSAPSSLTARGNPCGTLPCLTPAGPSPQMTNRVLGLLCSTLGIPEHSYPALPWVEAAPRASPFPLDPSLLPAPLLASCRPEHPLSLTPNQARPPCWQHLFPQEG